MNMRFIISILLLSCLSWAEPQADTKTKTKAAVAKAAVSDADIAAAKAKGMVWVNLNTGVYHKGGEFFGKTKSGQFMTEDDAKKAGHRAANEPGGKKGVTPKVKTAANDKTGPNEKTVPPAKK